MSNTEKMVSLPREVAEALNRSYSPPPAWAVKKLQAILKETDEQNDETPEQEGARLRRQGIGLSNLMFVCSEANAPGGGSAADDNHDRLLKGWLGIGHE